MDTHPHQQLVNLLDTLKKNTVWEMEGEDRHPRFIAVVSDPHLFQLLQEQAQEIRIGLENVGFSTRWLPTFFPEVWVHASVRTLEAHEAHRREGLVELPQKPVPVEDWPYKRPQLFRTLYELQQDGVKMKWHEVQETTSEDGRDVLPTVRFFLEEPWTLRRRSGTSYRLYGLSSSGEQHKNVKVGAVVLRGLEGNVQVNGRRKERRDRKEPHTSGFGYMFVK